MLARDPAGDGKSESRSFSSAPRRLTAEEPLEHPRQFFLLDADTGVFHREGGRAFLHRNRHPNLATGVGEFYSIVEHDHHQLTNQRGIADDGRLLELLYRDLDPFWPSDHAGGAG